MTKEFLCGRSLRKLYADGGYISGEFRSYVKRTFQAVVEVSKSLRRSSSDLFSLPALGGRAVSSRGCTTVAV